MRSSSNVLRCFLHELVPCTVFIVSCWSTRSTMNGLRGLHFLIALYTTPRVGVLVHTAHSIENASTTTPLDPYITGAPRPQPLLPYILLFGTSVRLWALNLAKVKGREPPPPPLLRHPNNHAPYATLILPPVCALTACQVSSPWLPSPPLLRARTLLRRMRRE